MRTKIVTLLVILSAGCSSFSDELFVRPMQLTESPCDVGSRCDVVGSLEIMRQPNSAVGRIISDSACFALALPENVLEHQDEWIGQVVSANGTVHATPYSLGSIDIKVLDRWVFEGVCPGEKVIYVDKITKM